MIINKYASKFTTYRFKNCVIHLYYNDSNKKSANFGYPKQKGQFGKNMKSVLLTFWAINNNRYKKVKYWRNICVYSNHLEKIYH